jgi:hypothetical protein
MCHQFLENIINTWVQVTKYRKINLVINTITLKVYVPIRGSSPQYSEIGHHHTWNNHQYTTST